MQVKRPGAKRLCFLCGCRPQCCDAQTACALRQTDSEESQTLFCGIQLSCEACKFAKVRLSCLIHPLSTQNTPLPNHDSFSFLDSCSFFQHCTEQKKKKELLAISETCLFCSLHSFWLFTTRRICLFRCDLTGKRKVSWLLWQPAEWLVGFDISTEWKRVETGGWWYCWRQIRAMCHWATAPRHSPRLLLAGISSKRESEREREKIIPF